MRLTALLSIVCSVSMALAAVDQASQASIRFPRGVTSESSGNQKTLISTWVKVDSKDGRRSIADPSIKVRWEVSTKSTFEAGSIVASGLALAMPVPGKPGLRASAQVSGLAQGQRYFFRFTAFPNGPLSKVGDFVAGAPSSNPNPALGGKAAGLRTAGGKVTTMGGAGGKGGGVLGVMAGKAAGMGSMVGKAGGVRVGGGKSAGRGAMGGKAAGVGLRGSKAAGKTGSSQGAAVGKMASDTSIGHQLQKVADRRHLMDEELPVR